MYNSNMEKTNIGVIGLGFVGNSIKESIGNKIIDYNLEDTIVVHGYDKYKNGGVGSFEYMVPCDILFLALPTLYNCDTKSYDYSSIYETCSKLVDEKFGGLVVIKSTVEPQVTEQLSSTYPELDFVHNPEFLTARTAYEDFHNQTHIVLGKSKNCLDAKFQKLVDIYKRLYQNATISLCTSTESESMKIFCNTFYAVKIQYFNELYLICQKLGTNYDKVVEMMLNNGWINPMHTNVPGPDGQLSYGGMCFPKDTNALLEYMKRLDVPHAVLDAVIKERNQFRDDNTNCK